MAWALDSVQPLKYQTYCRPAWNFNLNSSITHFYYLYAHYISIINTCLSSYHNKMEWTLRCNCLLTLYLQQLQPVSCQILRQNMCLGVSIFLSFRFHVLRNTQYISGTYFFFFFMTLKKWSYTLGENNFFIKLIFFYFFLFLCCFGNLTIIYFLNLKLKKKNDKII